MRSGTGCFWRAFRVIGQAKISVAITPPTLRAPARPRRRLASSALPVTIRRPARLFRPDRRASGQPRQGDWPCASFRIAPDDEDPRPCLCLHWQHCRIRWISMPIPSVPSPFRQRTKASTKRHASHSLEPQPEIPFQTDGPQTPSASTPLALFVRNSQSGTVGRREMALFRETKSARAFRSGRRNRRRPDQAKSAESKALRKRRPGRGRCAGVSPTRRGGRVQHLVGGPWSPACFAASANLLRWRGADFDLARRASRLSSRAMGAMMAELGLSSGCTPVLDLVFETTSAVIGARSVRELIPDIIAAPRSRSGGRPSRPATCPS